MVVLPLTLIRCVVIPTYETSIIASGETFNKLKLPSASVMVPTEVLRTCIVTPIRGSPEISLTFPLKVKF